MKPLAQSNFARRVVSFRRFVQRPLRQQWLIVEASMYLWGAKAVIVSLPFHRWRAILQRNNKHDRTTVTASPERLAEVIWAVERASRGRTSVLNCLPRAVAVRAMMARRKWESHLELGVAIDPDGAFHAHAWVEHGGKIVIGDVPDLGRYEKLPLASAAPASPPYPEGRD